MKTKVYRAHDCNDVTLDLVLAPDKKSATIYWQGKGIIPHSIEELDPEYIATITNVIPLINIIEKPTFEMGRSSKIIRVIGKGRH